MAMLKVIYSSSWNNTTANRNRCLLFVIYLYEYLRVLYVRMSHEYETPLILHS